MNLELKKCGELYVYFDEEKNPLYAFEVDYDTIRKFHLMSDNMPSEIILPSVKIKEGSIFKINNRSMLNVIGLEKGELNSLGLETVLESYARGAFKVATNCFKGIKKLKIVAPVDYSIMLDWGCVDDDAEVEFVLPEDMTLKQVFRTFDTHYEVARENWTIISHKAFNYDCDSYYGIMVRDFKPEDARYYKYTISEQRIAAGSLTSKQRKGDSKRFHTSTINPKLRQYKARDSHKLAEDFSTEL